MIQTINAFGYAIDPIHTIAPLIALLGLFVYLWIGKRHFGADADYWEIIRRTLLPQLNRLARRGGLGYPAYQLGNGEYLGKVDMDPETFEERLSEMGFHRMPLAAFKYSPDGRPEAGSWAWRPALLDTHQLHIHPFEADNGRTLVFGHAEYNAFNPLTAGPHYFGVNHRPLGDRGITLGDLFERGPRWVLAEALNREGPPDG